jgi:hypothetical protein
LEARAPCSAPKKAWTSGFDPTTSNATANAVWPVAAYGAYQLAIYAQIGTPDQD